MIPQDLFTTDKKIIARGIDDGASLDVFGLSYHAHTAQFNISSKVNYMISFPVLIWRDMLIDFRSLVNYMFHGVNESSVTLFMVAMNTIILREKGHTFLGAVCEFCLLLNYAHDNPYWKRRYQFDTWPTKEPMFSISQHHFEHCVKPVPSWERNNDEFIGNLTATAMFLFAFDPGYKGFMDATVTPTSLRSMQNVTIKRSQMLQRFTNVHILSDLSWYTRWNDDITARWYQCLRKG